jgi:hypothetical protein
MFIDSVKLLYSGYEYSKNIKLDLYGLPATDDEGHLVVTATLVGSKMGLSYILNDDVLDEMGQWLDEQTSRTVRVDRFKARAQRFSHECEMSRIDHQWRWL